jgi:hypothetical protein
MRELIVGLEGCVLNAKRTSSLVCKFHLRQ